MIEDRIKNRQAKIGVIGLGYVGLPLAVHFARNGYEVLGFDIKRERVNLVNQGKSYIRDAKQSELNRLVKLKKISATGDYNRVPECDVIQICVPTPVNINKEPDVSYIVGTTEEISKRLRKGQLIILKSTTFPKTTEGVMLPILERSGLHIGKDFFLAFSPERIDPGNKEFTLENTPTVVGGVTSRCTKLAVLLYKNADSNVISVRSPAVAELTKLIENTFRNVNIALMNELAQLCERMHINIWEAIDAASTKPFGFMPFYPGPGVGGHCIPIDPYYLSWKAREYDFHTSFIELSAKVNEDMPYYIAKKVVESLSKAGVCPSKARVLVLGVTFKKDVSDLRDSPALKIIEILEEKVGKVLYNDPYIENIVVHNLHYTSVSLVSYMVDESPRSHQVSSRVDESPRSHQKTDVLRNIDCVLIATDHSAYDYKKIVKNTKLVIDARNATKSVPDGLKGGSIVKLGC